MFSKVSNTSKFCLLYLIAILKKNLFSILDSQFYNKHLVQFGAFEMNKKMMIAQTIINTAAAVMATMKTGGFLSSPLAMLVAAMGAAQVAMIASTSYQGGGSTPG